MTTPKLIPAAAAVLVLAACGGSDTDNGNRAAASNHGAKDPSSSAEMTGPDSADKEPFATAKSVCSAFPRRQIAEDFGVRSAKPRALAKAYAADYSEAYRKSNYKGCLAGLKQRRRQ